MSDPNLNPNPTLFINKSNQSHTNGAGTPLIQAKTQFPDSEEWSNPMNNSIFN